MTLEGGLHTRHAHDKPVTPLEPCLRLLKENAVNSSSVHTKAARWREMRYRAHTQKKNKANGEMVVPYMKRDNLYDMVAGALMVYCAGCFLHFHDGGSKQGKKQEQALFRKLVSCYGGRPFLCHFPYGEQGWFHERMQSRHSNLAFSSVVFTYEPSTALTCPIEDVASALLLCESMSPDTFFGTRQDGFYLHGLVKSLVESKNLRMLTAIAQIVRYGVDADWRRSGLVYAAILEDEISVEFMLTACLSSTRCAGLGVA